ncbi:multisynthetase complex auxiliary component [Cyclospora cayetanensis]|uniref:Multisynthetase complex auxiliary component n=1 Tax=Cyclospora cayetanensis TaxID=88456 RepID=A0A1D3CX55_9EIME|nr:multisynthetase complex auxiliary component [Cyclospora cayetanensis]
MKEHPDCDLEASLENACSHGCPPRTAVAWAALFSCGVGVPTKPAIETKMELAYAVGTPDGAACALVASYAFPPGVVTIQALGRNAAKSAGQARINQWLSFFASKGFHVSSDSDLNELNSALQFNTFLCGNTLTAADLLGMASVSETIRKASAKECQALKNVMRWFDHMQNLPGAGASLSGIKEQRLQDFQAIDLPKTTTSDIMQAAEEVRRSHKDSSLGRQQRKQHQEGKLAPEKRADAVEKPAAAGLGKREKCKTPQAPKAEERPIDDPMRLDLRVGLVKKVWRHPEADKLYCEEIDFGPLGVRQIASGLAPFIPQEKFEGQKVVVLFNLKAKALRGFSSHGMVMCANNEDKSAVELLQPPEDAPLGERVTVQGMLGEPDEVLSAKKGKDPLVAVSPDIALVTPQGPVRCNSIKGGFIS